jgi:hypothetical protein
MKGLVHNKSLSLRKSIPLCSLHGNDAAEWSLSALSGCPDHWIAWFILGECAAQIGQKDQRLWLDSMLIQPVEAWTEVGPSAADGIEMNLLTGLIGLHFVYLCVEVQDVNALGPLAFEDRANLSFKESQ